MRKNITYETPIMFGDHHVLEVRRILLELPGVKNVYASSAFRIVEVEFEDEQITESQITQTLEAAGYLGDWSVPTESGLAAAQDTDRALTYFRHTEIYETTRRVVSFAQRVKYSSRPLWNCPGFGVIKNTMEE